MSTVAAQPVVDGLVIRQWAIIIFGAIPPILGNIRIYAVIARLGNAKSVFFERLLFRDECGV